MENDQLESLIAEIRAKPEVYLELIKGVGTTRKPILDLPPRSVTKRTMLWARIGTVFSEKPATAEEALHKAGLDWTVEQREAGYKRSDGSFSSVSGSFFTVRSDNENPLGLVKSRYKVLNNVDAFSFCDSLATKYGATFESAFDQKGGRVVGLVMKLPDGNSLVIDHKDFFDQYLIFRTTHDGTGAIQVAVQTVQNRSLSQFNLTLRHADYRTKIVHSLSTEGKLNNVRQAMHATISYDRAFEDECQRLIETPVNKTLSERLLIKCFQDAKYYTEPAKKDIALVLANRFTSDTIRDEVRNTAYGLMSSFTEYFQHNKKFQSNNAAFEFNTRGIGARIQHNLSLALAELHS